MCRKVVLVAVLVFAGAVYAFQLRAIRASGGEDSTLAEFSADSLYGCGRNNEGQLGMGSRKSMDIFA